MAYLVYEVESTRIVKGRNGRTTYDTERAAKAARTRALRTTDEELGVAQAAFFYAEIEKKVKRVNLMSRKEYWEPINTPLSCSPASETYWSM